MAAIALKNITSRIATAIMESLDKDVSLWSDEMEQKYPEWKGSRIKKRSGNQYQRKLIFGYDNKQAAELEAGIPAKRITERYVQQVTSHKRKRKGLEAPTRVRAHQRFYTGYIPIQLPNGQWRMISKIPERKATKPVSKSAKKRYTGKAMERLIADSIKQEFK